MSLKKLESVRGEIASVKAQISELGYPALTPEELPVHVANVVSELATRFNAEEAVAWPTAMGRSLLAEKIPPDQVLPLLAWLDPLALRDRLLHAAKPLATGTVPIEQRAAKVRGLEDRLHELEVQEEALICALEATGTKVDRRQGIDPAVFLGMTDDD